MSLYAGLNYLNKTTVNIASVEDPVEVRLSGINQVQVYAKIGLSFANVLRSFLRQDPDILMIGEMRDSETAAIAIKAAQTGHLVLSTLHTNSSLEAVHRLQHMGIASHQIINTVVLVVAQRLLRRLCEYCKKNIDIDACHRSYQSAAVMINTDKAFEAAGCSQCQQGYSGRVALFEMLAIDSEWQDCFERENTLKSMRALAKRKKLETLYKAGLKKIAAGLTTFAELERVVGVDYA